MRVINISDVIRTKLHSFYIHLCKKESNTLEARSIFDIEITELKNVHKEDYQQIMGVFFLDYYRYLRYSKNNNPNFKEDELLEEMEMLEDSEDLFNKLVMDGEFESQILSYSHDYFSLSEESKANLLLVLAPNRCKEFSNLSVFELASYFGNITISDFMVSYIEYKQNKEYKYSVFEIEQMAILYMTNHLQIQLIGNPDNFKKLCKEMINAILQQVTITNNNQEKIKVLLQNLKQKGIENTITSFAFDYSYMADFVEIFFQTKQEKTRDEKKEAYRNNS